MSLPLTASSDLTARKDLIRLRMEMYRQQLLYNAQPLVNPLRHARNLFGQAGSHEPATPGKGPLLVGVTLILALFGRRLGKAGKLLRVGLALYPLIKGRRLLLALRH